MQQKVIVEPYNVTVQARVEQRNGFKLRERKVDGQRPLSFEDAKYKYRNRFTMEHTPTWALKPLVVNGKQVWPGPHYATDKEWYNNTEFLGEGTRATRKYCRSMNQTYPLGKYLDKPYPQFVLERTTTRVIKRKAKPAKAKKA